jgi:hypothetical protein
MGTLFQMLESESKGSYEINTKPALSAGFVLSAQGCLIPSTVAATFLLYSGVV